MFDSFEHRSAPLLSPLAFARRVAKFGLMSFSLLGGSLLLGMVGYRTLEGLSWLDAFLNAAMILGGMGPIDTMKTPAGKLFAGSYALFAGIVFLGAVGVLLAPILHRIQHRFHLEVASGQGRAEE